MDLQIQVKQNKEYDELVQSEIVPIPFMDKKQMINAQELAKKFY